MKYLITVAEVTTSQTSDGDQPANVFKARNNGKCQ